MEKLINSMLCQFQRNLDFLVNFHQSLESIASMEDNFKEIVQAANSTNKEAGIHKGNNKGVILGNKETKSVQSVLVFRSYRNMNSEVLENILNFKFVSLNLARKLFNLIGALFQVGTYPQEGQKLGKIELISPVNLGKLFVQFSSSKELIEKAKELVREQIAKKRLPISAEMAHDFEECKGWFH